MPTSSSSLAAPTRIAPHGGALIDRVVPAARAVELVALAAMLPRLVLDDRELADLELIATGAASPLIGFLGEADYQRVLAEGRLCSGVVWPVPFVLGVLDSARADLTVGGDVALHDPAGRLRGVLRGAEVFARDAGAEATVLPDDRTPAPGRSRWLVGGAVDVLPLPAASDRSLARLRLGPAQVRAILAARGWNQVAALPVPDLLQRPLEHAARLALELCDGLVVLAPAGDDPGDDAARFASHEALIARYLPADRVIVVAVPGAARAGGARPALLDAIIARNHGLARPVAIADHAGFDRYARRDLGVDPLRLAAGFYCRTCAAVASPRSCDHEPAGRVELAGAQVRELVRAGAPVPVEILRPEATAVLRARLPGAVPVATPVVAVLPLTSLASLGGEASRRPATRPGFIVWLTGMSGAGKNTLAAALVERLAGERTLEVLDGDEVRETLSPDLGFSRADRDANVRRVALIARTLGRHGVGVIAAMISPYAAARGEARALAEAAGVAFVEVHVDAELASLIARDVKGLYKRALAGEVEHFTGISDPYEAPTAADVVVRTDVESVDECAARILAALRARGLVREVAAPPPAAIAAGRSLGW